MKIFIFSETSLDGKLTIANGVSSKVLFDLLCDEDFKFIHSFREAADGIMVGKNTVNIDNPSLTNRYGDKTKQPVRIIPSNSLNFNFGSTIFSDSNETVIVTSRKNQGSINSKIIEDFGKEILYFGDNEVDFREMVTYFEDERNFKKIMVEGGSTLNWGLLSAGLIDEIMILQLPIVIGGSETPGLFGGSGFKNMTQIPVYSLEETRQFGDVFFMKYVNQIR